MLNIPAEIRKWVALGVLLVLLLFLFAVLAMCHAKDEAREADAAATIADGRTAASADVNDIRDAADERIAEIRTEVKNATAEIYAADDPVDRSRAAELGLCRIDAGSSPNCGLLLANPR